MSQIVGHTKTDKFNNKIFCHSLKCQNITLFFWLNAGYHKYKTIKVSTAFNIMLYITFRSSVYLAHINIVYYTYDIINLFALNIVYQSINKLISV